MIFRISRRLFWFNIHLVYFLQQTGNKKGHDGDEAFSSRTDQKKVTERLDTTVRQPLQGADVVPFSTMLTIKMDMNHQSVVDVHRVMYYMFED